jgi:phage protein D
MARPFFKITQGGNDITQKIGSRNISLSITDGVGFDSDTVSYEIDDQDGAIALPKTGVKISVTAGYRDNNNSRDFGIFIVDQVSLSGWPQKISINAQSVGAKTAVKEKKVKSYSKKDYPTYGDIYAEIASQSGLTLAISSDIKSVANEYEAQSEETPLEFGSRIGENLDAHVSGKNGRLVVVKRGAGKSASGATLPEFKIAPGVNLVDYSVSLKDTPKHKNVKAKYYDREEATRKEVTASSSSEGPDFLIREVFPTEEEAQRAADAKGKNLVRISGEASFTIVGNPFVMAEQLITVEGVRSGVDGSWRVKTVTHSFSATGAYTTSITCEVPE